MRVGWFVVPEGLRAAYDDRAVSTYISPPLLPQAIVHELHERGAFEPNLDRIRGILRAQRDAMLGALESELGGRATWSRPEGGYFLWLDLGDGVDAGELLTRATEAGVTFVRGSDFFPGEGGASAARLAFSYEPPERIADGVRSSPACSSSAASRRGSSTSAARSGRARRREHAQEDQPDEARVDGEEHEADLLLLAVHQQEQDRVDSQGRPRGRSSRGSRRLSTQDPPGGDVGRSRGDLRRWRDAIGATCTTAGGRSTSRGCGGGASRPTVAALNVGHVVFPGRAQRPAWRK